MSLQQLHWLDLAIAAVVIVSIARGFRNGVFRQAMKLAAYVVAFCLALALHPSMEEWLRRELPQAADKITRLSSFLITYVTTWIVLTIASGTIQSMVRCAWGTKRNAEGESVIETLGLTPMDRLAGAGIGAIAGCLLVGVSLIGLGNIQDADWQQRMAGSKLAPHFVEGTREVLAAIPGECTEELKRALDRLHQACKSVAKDMAQENIQTSSARLNGMATGVERLRNAFTRGGE